MEGRRGFFNEDNVKESIFNSDDFWLRIAEALPQATAIELCHLLEIERTARRLLSVIDKAPYRLTAQTFGEDAVEAGAALEGLRAALNVEHDVNHL